MSDPAVRTAFRPALGGRWSPRALRVPGEVWIIGGLTVLAATLRFATLAHQSLWLDEALTANDVHLSFGAMLSTVASHEANPPLYYVLAWMWTRILGFGDAGLRSLSALWGTAVIPIAYLCARELASHRAALIAGLLAAINPFMIWYSQEARPYMLLAALSGASFLWFVRASREPGSRPLGWWATFSALALLTHFFAGFLVAPQALWLLWRARRRAAVLAVGAVAVVQVALIPLVVSDSGNGLGWIKVIPLTIRIKQIPVEFGLGTLYKSSLVVHGLLIAAVLTTGVIGLLAVAGDRPHRRGAAVAASIAAVVLLVPLLLTQLGHDYLITRNLIPAWIPLVVLVAIACAAPRARLLGAAVAAALAFAFVLADIRIDNHAQYQRPDWRDVAAALGATSSPRAIVASGGAFAAEPLAVYMPRIPWAPPGPAPVTVREVDVVGSAWQAPAGILPAGTRLISNRRVNEFRVERFVLDPPWNLSPARIGALAGGLSRSLAPAAIVLLQHGV
jgi:hypothetical protein